MVLKLPLRGRRNWCAGHYKGLVFLEHFNQDADTDVDAIVGRFSWDVKKR